MFLTVSHFHPSLIFYGKAVSLSLDSTQGSTLRVSPAHIRLGWKWLTVTNCLAYFTSALIMAVKSFIVHAPRGSFSKEFLSRCFLIKLVLTRCQNLFPLSPTLWTNKLECFSIFSQVLIFSGQSLTYITASSTFDWLHFKGRHLGTHSNKHFILFVTSEFAH